MSGAAIAGEVTCPICLELFDDPRLLDCTHSFCVKCLALIVKPGKHGFFFFYSTSITSSSSTIFHTFIEGITCPTCRKITKSATNADAVEK
jgi:hypothetical protein